MQFKKGEKIIINGKRRNLKNYFYELAVNFVNQRKKILIVDTSNSLNPHHPIFNDVKQKIYFDCIYCVRTPMPYDLWARLGSSGSFIEKKKIDVLLFTNLSLLFREFSKKETIPLVKNILKRIDYLTKKYNLISIIPNSPSNDETAFLASEFLLEQQRTMEIQ